VGEIRKGLACRNSRGIWVIWRGGESGEYDGRKRGRGKSRPEKRGVFSTLRSGGKGMKGRKEKWTGAGTGCLIQGKLKIGGDKFRVRELKKRTKLHKARVVDTICRKHIKQERDQAMPAGGEGKLSQMLAFLTMCRKRRKDKGWNTRKRGCEIIKHPQSMFESCTTQTNVTRGMPMLAGPTMELGN